MNIWVPIEGWPYYEITPYGDIRSVDRYLVNRRGQRKFYRGQILKPYLTIEGYLSVQLCDDAGKLDKSIHVLVCSTFHGDCPDGMNCRHLDDNKINNYYENLMWGTPKQNMQDAIRNGAKLGPGTFPPVDPKVLSDSAKRRWSNPGQRVAQSERVKEVWRRRKNLRT